MLNSEKALEDPKKVAIHDDVLANFDIITWSGNNLLYHRSDFRVTTWQIRSLNVGLVGHAWVVHLLGGFLVLPGPFSRISPLSFMGLGWSCWFFGNGIHLVLFVPDYIYIYLIGDMMVSDDAKQAILQACLLMNGYEEAHYHM